jgi:hypothetical protein
LILFSSSNILCPLKQRRGWDAGRGALLNRSTAIVGDWRGICVLQPELGFFFLALGSLGGLVPIAASINLLAC